MEQNCLKMAGFAMSSKRIKDAHINEMKVEFNAVSENEGFARIAVASFLTHLNPTLEEVDDVKTAVSEAVTNAIIHGYGIEENQTDSTEKVCIICRIEENRFYVTVIDRGRGIENIAKAMEPLFTTKPEMERSGMGFSFMEAFMDELKVESELGKGTSIHMCKSIGCSNGQENK